MSIFKATFSDSVKKQLSVRQDAMNNRTSKNLTYLNSRNAWIRLTSSVNIVTSTDEDGNPKEDDGGALAKKYILQGGVLNVGKSINDGSLRSGLGGFNKAYSNTAADGTAYRLGIRPMPGITSVDIKSKSAYGSLREAVVNFQCWDIKQLEDLEILYMRPGYTVLLEWGWIPYLDNKGELSNNIVDNFYDIVGTIKPKEDIWKELFQKSNNNSNNYDAIFGYVKNYSWSARPDGGYDCQTTIITMGELIESLKVNYVPSNTDLGTKGTGGLLKKECTDPSAYDTAFAGGTFSAYYQKNILAGIWAETYNLLSNTAIKSFVSTSPLNGNNHIQPNLYLGKSTNTNKSDSISSGGIQCYITIGAFLDMINNILIPIDTSSQRGSLVRLSVTGKDGDDLLCVAHPLQVSTDLGVCAINSPLWSGGEIISAVTEAQKDPGIAKLENTANEIAKEILDAAKGGGTNIPKLEAAIKQIENLSILQIVNERIIEDGNYKNSPESGNVGNLQDLFNDELDRDNTNTVKLIKTQLGRFGVIVNYKTASFQRNGQTYEGPYIKNTLKITYNDAPLTSTTIIADLDKTTQQAPQALANIKWLQELKSYFKNEDPYSELGIIKNIYLNVDFLYKSALDTGLESQDKKGKNEINLYNYVKKIISAVQAALGNVSSFEIHVDPIDNNIGRIIDVNYTGDKGNNIYDSLFELQVHNLKSAVRSYTLQSQIFPEQSSIIAIGSQVQGGQLGIQNNTMIDFNRQIKDRILPAKTIPDAQKNLESSKEGANLISSLSNIVKYFRKSGEEIESNTTVDTNDTFGDVKNALRDVIVYFQSITSSPGKNRNLIPIKFSLEMDGIGGLVIGHMFRLPKDILPKGYKGEGVGAELGQAITSIGHTLSGNDWSTKIDALNIVLTDNNKLISFKKLDLKSVLTELVKEAVAPSTTSSPNGEMSAAEDNQKYPVLVKYYAWSYEYNSTVQKYSKVSDQTPIANALRLALDKNYIVEKGVELSSNGDITEDLKTAVLKFQSNLKSTAGFNFINGKKPIRITAGNDTYHRTYGDKRNRTTHGRGLAIDIGTKEFTQPQIDSIMNLLKSSGFVGVIYHGGSALHIHANISTT
jgi:hypothetical protein